MSNKFFRVKQSPKTWKDSNGKSNNTVIMAPWERTTFSVRGVAINGRKSWNAPYPIWKNEVIYYNTSMFSLMQTYTNIVVHHTNNSDSIAYNEKKQQGKRYAALGYHFFIDQKGDVYEGRPIEVMGSHAGAGLVSGVLADPDWGSIGIVLQGDYHNADNWFFQNNANTPKVQFEKLEELILALSNKYVIHQLLMHKEVIRKGKPTVCPGDHLASRVKALREKLQMRGAK